MYMRIFIIAILFSVLIPSEASALTFFGNIRGNCREHRYYKIDGYTPAFVGYQDIYDYPYTYQLPWNRCFNYCTRCPRPCFKSRLSCSRKQESIQRSKHELCGGIDG